MFEFRTAMLRPATSIQEKMIKVNHAGENGAVNIYRGQIVFGRFFGRIQLQKLREYESHEKEHREIFAKYLEINGIRKCISYHLCGIGGLALGVVTGLLGKQAIAATTFAVENVVVKHLQGQLIYLRRNDAVAAECVSKIIDDENTHLSESEGEFNAEKLLNRIAIAVVSFCTEAIIKFGMR